MLTIVWWFAFSLSLYWSEITGSPKVPLRRCRSFDKTPSSIGNFRVSVSETAFSEKSLVIPLLVVVAVTLVAGTIPARRASKLDPLLALREE